MKKFTFFFMLFSIFYANAQWVTDTAVNTLVSTDSSPSIDCKSIGTSDGKTFVVYWKSAAAPKNYELRVQLLDANGNIMFGPNGLLISDTIPMGTYTSFWKIKTDASNNLYVSVTGTGSGTPAIVFKIDTSGTNLWGSNGINLGTGYLSTVCPLSNGDVLIGYFPGSGQSKIQRFTSEGIPIWATPINVLAPVATNVTILSDIYELSNQDFVVIFHKRLGSFGTNSNLFAQRYNSTGAIQWSSPTQLSNRTTVYNRIYSSSQDNDVIYYGYYGADSNRFDSYLLRLNADGTLPWGINGVDFDTNQTNFETETQVKTVSSSNFLWAICHYTNTNQTINGEYIQKIDKLTGARLFTNTAKEIFPIDSNNIVHASNLKLIDDTPLFIAKIGADNGVSPTTLNMVKLDNNGDFVWPGQYIPVATYSANKSQVDFTEPINNEGVTVFVEQKTSVPLIYAQKTNTILSRDAFSSNSFAIYPNPSKDSFCIESLSPIKSVSIYNIIGQQVYTSNFNNITKTYISTNNWMNGVYIVEIKSDNGLTKSYKLIKQ